MFLGGRGHVSERPCEMHRRQREAAGGRDADEKRSFASLGGMTPFSGDTFQVLDALTVHEVMNPSLGPSCDESRPLVPHQASLLFQSSLSYEIQRVEESSTEKPAVTHLGSKALPSRDQDQ
ncbi:hypothetical protein NDU88_007079 [Pleurodeles waltl]|uniref:Uncharacterized protein n=1 Tax=Pleurodeles waltl TaxID=8319 RepID=A0AAV7PP79_PLEWA|nr:hypothetical protein NDU88_007079 [Pleurodeles waltl]